MTATFISIKQWFGLITIGLVITGGVVGVVSLSAPVGAQSDAIILEGGQSKQTATPIGAGQTIQIEKASDNNNWYKLPINNGGTLVTVKIGAGEWNEWDIYKMTVGSAGVRAGQLSTGATYQYVATESAVYINFDADEGVSGNRFTVTTSNPDQEVFEIKRLTVLPDSEFQPNETATVQANVFYDRDSVLNPESINATLTIGGRVIATKTVKGAVNTTKSVQFTESIPADMEPGTKELSVHVRPVWAERGGNEKSKTITVEQQDIDGDGLLRSREINLGTDPSTPDSDGDGIDDGRELEINTDPTNEDSDSDGVIDGTEIKQGADPLVTDTDDDTIGDAEEINRGMNPDAEDTDGDGLGDARELELGTDPTKADTDGDGLTDKEEIEAGSDPTVQTSRTGKAGPLALSGPDSVEITNGNVTLTYTLSVTGPDTILNGTSLDLNGIKGWTVVDQSGSGTFRTGATQWLFLSVTSGENKTVSVTLSPPASTGKSATIKAIATDAEGHQDMVTTSVNLDTVDVTTAIDQNGNGQLELVEVQRAIRLWRNNKPVPNTGGMTLDIETMQKLISIWAENKSI